MSTRDVIKSLYKNIDNLKSKQKGLCKHINKLRKENNDKQHTIDALNDKIKDLQTIIRLEEVSRHTQSLWNRVISKFMFV